jgi:cytochrome c biogenesis protein CcmG/thiol:disulfide interchange protein DsbE
LLRCAGGIAKGSQVNHPSHTLLALLLALALGLATGCGGGDDQDTADAGTEAGASGTTAFGIGNPAPDFALQDIHGEEIRLSDHRGKAVVVDFWATWCGPCRRVMPTLQELSVDYADQLSVLAVSVDQDPAAVVPEFAQKHGLTFTLFADPQGMRVAQEWGGIRSIPTSFLVAPDGTVVKQWVGVHGKDEYEREIKKVLGLAAS